MMKRLLVPLALGLIASAPLAQDVGSQLTSDFELEGLALTKAKTFDDFAGRAVLIEFFAFW
jgi:hypothetical protein